MNWSIVFEVALGAVLAFVFGSVLQLRILHRQERFQKELLERQLSFLEKLERDRTAGEEAREKNRTEVLRSIAQANLSHESMLKFIEKIDNQ